MIGPESYYLLYSMASVRTTKCSSFNTSSTAPVLYHAVVAVVTDNQGCLMFTSKYSWTFIFDGHLQRKNRVYLVLRDPSKSLLITLQYRTTEKPVNRGKETFFRRSKQFNGLDCGAWRESATYDTSHVTRHPSDVWPEPDPNGCSRLIFGYNLLKMVVFFIDSQRGYHPHRYRRERWRPLKALPKWVLVCVMFTYSCIHHFSYVFCHLRLFLFHVLKYFISCVINLRFTLAFHNFIDVPYSIFFLQLLTSRMLRTRTWMMGGGRGTSPTPPLHFVQDLAWDRFYRSLYGEQGWGIAVV